MTEFLAMGGYAAFVWGSYGMALACIVLEVWLLRRREKKA